MTKLSTYYSVCHRPLPNVLTFEAEERKKGWNITARLEFSPAGYKAIRTFVNQDLTTTKYYQRLHDERDVQQVHTPCPIKKVTPGGGNDTKHHLFSGTLCT